MTSGWQKALRIVVWLGLGIILGIAVGLLIGWVVWPIEFSEADPTVLEDSYQHEYTVMIASAYSLNQDPNLARQRLQSLGKEDVDGWLLSVTVNHILAGADEMEIEHLVKLCTDFGLYSPAMDPYLIDGESGGGG
jgi:hypothetical protein